MKEVGFRRFISVLLAAAVLFGAGMSSITGSVIGGIVSASLTVSAAEAMAYGEYEYELGDDGSGITITKYKGNDADVVVPGEISGTKVVKIGEGAFAECDSVTSIFIPESVTDITGDSFHYCSNLKTINVSGNNPAYTSNDGVLYNKNKSILLSCPEGKDTICYVPYGVREIADYAFENCHSLISVSLPETLKKAGEGAFIYCDGISSLVLPAGMEIIGKAAFYGCSKVNISSIPSNVKQIGEGAFFKCEGITNITIPSGITSIEKALFYKCTNLKTISIPDSVVSIGEGAFYECTNLEGIAIPDGVTDVDVGVFYGCSSLSEVKLSAKLKSLPERVFSNCSSLTEVTIPDSVASIGGYAFFQCEALEKVRMSAKIKSIGEAAFFKCESLFDIVIPESTCEIGLGAFTNCSSLVSINIPSGVTSISEGCFGLCSGLKSITLHNGITSIGRFAFIGCKSLESVSIPAGLTIIDYAVFNECASLKSIYIPDNITSIGDGAFYGCTGLTEAVISDSVKNFGADVFQKCDSLTIYGQKGSYAETYAEENSIPFEAITEAPASDFEYETGTDGFITITKYKGNDAEVVVPEKINEVPVTVIGDQAFYYCPNLQSVRIPNGVTSIGDYAFYDCSGLTSITMPDSVTSIGSGAFYCCIGLTDVTISNSLTSIGKEAFFRCTKLQSVTIPDSVTSICKWAFNGCVSLKSVTIPVSVTSIESMAFSGCENLQSIDVNINNPVYSSYNGIVYDKNINKLIACPGAKTSVNIPDGVTSIGEYAFDECTKLQFVNIPESVTNIEQYAFSSCTSLPSITIPKSVTSIGERAFHWCTSLSYIILPDSVTSIGMEAFSYCKNLQSAVIPNSVKSIGTGIFFDCTGLQSVTIPDSVTSIGNSAFFYCTILKSVTIPNSVKSIGMAAFSNCTSLQSVTIPNGVTSIEYAAFGDCTSLKSVIIRKSVTDIGEDAFRNCPDLTIYGETGSCAETYANDNGIPFKAISEEKISVTSLTITLSQTVFTYDGSEKRPAVTATDGTKTLVKGTDYTLSYENNTEAGTAYAVINGTGSYGDTARISYTINKRSTAFLTITLSQTVFTYDGSEKRPAVTATDGTKTLVKGTDYTLSYSDNISAGTGRVTVKGINNYTGEQSKTFTIGRRSLENAVLTVKPGSFTYDGTGKKPAVTLTLDGRTLTTDDYAVVYSNNVNAGTAKVVVNGRINYNGSAEKTFKISPLSITPFSIVLESDTYTYDDNPKTPAVTVTNGTKKLTQGTDFTVVYSDNISEGTGYVTVKGIRNYSGSVKKSFTIEPPPKISISDMLITVNASFGIVYNGEPRTPEVIIQKGKTRLKKGTDFRCTYSDNINAGTASIKIEGIGKYDGIVTKSFTILPMSIYKASVSVAENSITYDGKKQTPRVDVELNGKTLARGTDFSVTYSNNTNIGISIVTITGKNNYTGHAYGKFSIVSGKKQFVWGQDNYNFINSSSLGYFPKMTYRSMINKTYLDVLANKYTLTNSEYQTVFIGNGEKVAWLDEPFDGACYGMASTAFLAKSGFLNAGDYMTGAKNIYDLNYPINNEKLCSLIIYYQMIQVKNVIMQQRKKVAKMSNEAVIKGIRELLDNNSLVLVGFKKEKWGAHAIIAYGYDNDMHIKNGKTYNGRIWIYDPNKSTEKNEDFFIYYNSSDNYSWTIPGYRQNSDISSGAGACFSYYGASVDDINSGGYLFRVNKIFNNSLSDYIARIDAYKLSGDGHVNKVSADPSRIGTYMNAASAPDEIVADYSYIIAGKGAGTMGYNLYDSDSAYKVSQDKPSELDLSIDYEYCDLSARAESCNSVIFDKDGRVVLDCENSGYTVSMTFDDDYPTDYFAVRVSGADANNVTFEKAENGYILRADNIRNLKIFANNRTDTVTAGLSATKYKSVLIYETDSSTLGLKVDTDGNGTFETKLSVYSILENNSVISAQKIKKGSSVKVSASASGGSGGYTYAVLYKKHASSNWVTVQGFKENSTVSIKPASAGLYDICVKARDSKGNVDKKYFSVNVIAPLENDSTISATSISKGSSVIVKADATGGTGSYEYAVYYKKASSSSWSTVQKYKTNSRITITPSAAVVYDICVKVKDSAGSISKKYFTINVVAAPLTNKSTVSSKSIRLGGSVTVKASASGGSGSYNFAVLYKKSDKTSWTTKQSYSTNSTVTIKPGAAVDYDIMVKAKDSSGAVAT